MALAAHVGIGISALYPPPILLKRKLYFLSILSYEASYLDNHPTSCLLLPIRHPAQQEIFWLIRVNTCDSSPEPLLSSC